MYLMNFKTMDTIEKQAFRIKQIASIALAIEDAMAYAPTNSGGNYTLAVTNLAHQLEDVYEALYEAVRQRVNIPDAPPAATSEAEKHGKEGV